MTPPKRGSTGSRTPQSQKSASPAELTPSMSLSAPTTSRQLRPRLLTATASVSSSRSSSIGSREDALDASARRGKRKRSGLSDGRGRSNPKNMRAGRESGTSTEAGYSTSSPVLEDQPGPSTRRTSTPPLISASTPTARASNRLRSANTVSSASLARLLHSTNVDPHSTLSSSSPELLEHTRTRSFSPVHCAQALPRETISIPSSSPPPTQRVLCGPLQSSQQLPDSQATTPPSTQPTQTMSTQSVELTQSTIPSQRTTSSASASQTLSHSSATLMPQPRAGSSKSAQLEIQPLSSYCCPICFCPPTNATLTPCGHIACGSCLFKAVKAGIARGAWRGGEGDDSGPKCPVCRANIPEWDGKGGGVVGLKMRAVFSL